MVAFAEFCAGIGGFRLGLAAVGWNCVFLVRSIPNASKATKPTLVRVSMHMILQIYRLLTYHTLTYSSPIWFVNARQRQRGVPGAPPPKESSLFLQMI